MSLFLELLQVSIGSRDRLTHSPSQKEWLALFDASCKQAVVGILFQGVEFLPEEQKPPKDILLQWIGIVQLQERKNILFKERARELTELFESNGLFTCVLKGLSSARRYSNPSRRQNGDIDLWVLAAPKEVLLFLRKRFDVKRILYHHADVSIFNDVDTEIHYRPSWLFNPVYNNRLQKWFEEQSILLKEVSPSEDGYKVTTNSFDAVYQLIHVSHHLMDMGVGVRHVLDYYYVLIGLSPEERKDAIKTLKRLGMEKLACGMMYVLQVLFVMPKSFLLCTPNEKEGRFLLDDILARGNFGNHSDNRRFDNTRYMRNIKMFWHYPSEVLWMFPWRVWHFLWRKIA